MVAPYCEAPEGDAIERWAPFPFPLRMRAPNLSIFEAVSVRPWAASSKSLVSFNDYSLGRLPYNPYYAKDAFFHGGVSREGMGWNDALVDGGDRTL